MLPAVTPPISAPFPPSETIFGDNKYHNHDLQAWMATHRPTWPSSQSCPEGAQLYALAQRWVVEHQRLERSGS